MVKYTTQKQKQKMLRSVVQVPNKTAKSSRNSFKLKTRAVYTHIDELNIKVCKVVLLVP